MHSLTNSQMTADTDRIFDLAIIGGGFSAAALVIHLCKSAPRRARQIAIVSEDCGRQPFGSGAAFGTDNPHYRLNVRAEIMKLFSDSPDDFKIWAEAHICDAEASRPEGDFYQRRDFARYMTDTLEKICIDGLPEQISTTATTLRQQDNLWHISHSAGAEIRTKMLVLATGNPPPIWPCAVTSSGQNRLVVNPWDGSWQKRLETDDALCLIGGGLTAMDGIYAAAQTGHKGRIMLVSPQGMLPPAQTGWQAQPPISWPKEQLTASRFFGHMRTALKGAGDDWTQSSWQERFEALRIELSEVYWQMSGQEKRRLLRRAASWWSLARYRSAPQNFAAAQQMLSSGQLSIIQDRVISLDEEAGEVRIGLASGNVLSSDMAVNCSGVATDPFFERLIADNIICPCAFGQSPEVTQNLAVCRPESGSYDTLFALGAATRGSFGDVVGAGTIARQAEELAKILASGNLSDLC